MRSRNLFLKPRSSFHGRWWIIALMLAGLYLLVRAPGRHSQDELPWQPPIEPNGVMIRESAAANLPTSTPASSASAPKEQQVASDTLPAATSTMPIAQSNPGTAENSTDPQAQIRQVIGQWSHAWSSRNVNAYLGAYAQSFVPEGGQDRSAWEQTRRQRILSKSAIVHEVRNLQITLEGNKAAARFEQTYIADRVRSVGEKTLRLVLEGDKWLIVAESTS